MLVVVLLLLVPAFVRVSVRRRRLRAAGGADAEAAARAAWDEVVGTAADYGVPVRASETPRGLARRLGHELDLDDDAGRGLRLVALAEQARYAAHAGWTVTCRPRYGRCGTDERQADGGGAAGAAAAVDGARARAGSTPAPRRRPPRSTASASSAAP